MKTKSKAKQITIMGLLAALILIFSMTPIGSIPIGPLVITLNVIPVSIAAIVLGPVGGMIMGGFFGLLSFLQCFGIGVPSALGIALLEETDSVLFTFLSRFIPRLLTGLAVGLVHNLLKKKINVYASSVITGFLTAFLNTVLFVTALVLFFGNTEEMQKRINGQNILLFMCVFVGFNAVAEWIITPVISGAVGSALYKSKLIE